MRTGLKALEIAMNRYVQLDPDTVERMAALSGKNIAIHITDWRLNWMILPNEKGFILSDDYHLVPDVTLCGTLFDMMKVSFSKGSTTSLFKNKIEMSGDTETGEKIREILSRIEIDWEEHFSHIVGDAAAHQTFRGIHKIKLIGKKLISTVSFNIREYLQMEASLLPSSDHVTHFFKEVGRLRDDVDRLEARLHRLENRKKH